MNQNHVIAHHLLKPGARITQYEATLNYGVLRLSQRVTELEDLGFLIMRHWVDGVNRYGNKVRYMEYRMPRMATSIKLYKRHFAPEGCL